MSDVEKTVTAIQGNSIKREILNAEQEGQVLTWSGVESQWSAQPVSPDGVILINDLTFETATGVHMNIGAPVLGTEDSITISTDCINGGNNGALIINSGVGPLSLSGSAHNVYINSGSQNGSPQGSILLTTGYGVDNGQTIVLDSLTGTIDASTSYTAQMCMTAQNIRFNSSGFIFSRILEVYSNYTINDGRTMAFDYIILADTTTAALTVDLPPSPEKGETYIVKDNGNAGTNNVTVDGNGNNIDGAGTFVISTNYGAATFIFNDTQWNIISRV